MEAFGKNIEEKVEEPKLIEDDSLKQQLKIFFSASNLSFTNEEINSIYDCAVRLNKDTIYMMQVLLAFKQRIDDKTLDPVEDKVRYLCKMIEKGSQRSSTTREKGSNFINFKQNEYDFDDLESKLLDN